MNNVTSLGAYMLQANLADGEARLPVGYVDYRSRVRRWQSMLERVSEKAEAAARANAAYINAYNEWENLFDIAKRMGEQLRETERLRGWKREDVR